MPLVTALFFGTEPISSSLQGKSADSRKNTHYGEYWA